LLCSPLGHSQDRGPGTEHGAHCQSKHCWQGILDAGLAPRIRHLGEGRSQAADRDGTECRGLGGVVDSMARSLGLVVGLISHHHPRNARSVILTRA
jgi:hypothetical protein